MLYEYHIEPASVGAEWMYAAEERYLRASVSVRSIDVLMISKALINHTQKAVKALILLSLYSCLWEAFYGFIAMTIVYIHYSTYPGDT